jgi:hypothetical protein
MNCFLSAGVDTSANDPAWWKSDAFSYLFPVTVTRARIITPIICLNSHNQNSPPHV